jgi:hypothetical protein
VEHHPAEQSLDQSHRNTGRIKWASKIYFTLSRGKKKISHPKTFPKIAENRQTGSFSPIISSYGCQACSAKDLTYTRLRRNLHKPAMQISTKLWKQHKMSDGYKCSWEQNMTMNKIVTFMRVANKSVRLSVTFTMTNCHDTTWWSQAMKSVQ